MCGWVSLFRSSSKSFFVFGLLFLLELRKLQDKNYVENNVIIKLRIFRKPIGCLDEKITDVSNKVLNLSGVWQLLPVSVGA